VDEVVEALGAHHEGTHDLAPVALLAVAVDHALLDEVDDDVGEHLGVDAEVALVGQGRADGRRDRPDAHLDGCAVGDEVAISVHCTGEGLSGGVAALASAFFLVLAILHGQFLVATLSAALMGACLGFLRYNFNPASIFMGDAGSLFLGFVLAAVGIRLRFPGQLTVISWMIPVLVLGVPLFDTTLVVVSRLRRRLNPLTNPGRDHLSHRLVAVGFSQRQAVLFIYSACIFLGLLSLLIAFSALVVAYAAASVVALGALAALVLLERVDYRGRVPAPTN